jgi:hypothetical protein
MASIPCPATAIGATLCASTSRCCIGVVSPPRSKSRSIVWRSTWIEGGSWASAYNRPTQSKWRRVVLDALSLSASIGTAPPHRRRTSLAPCPMSSWEDHVTLLHTSSGLVLVVDGAFLPHRGLCLRGAGSNSTSC